VIHKPRGLLRYSDGAVNFLGTDSVLAVHNLPHCAQPLVQSKRRIFKDRSGLYSKLAFAVVAAALPAVVIFLKLDLRTPANRTGYTIRPATHYHVFAAVDGI